MSHWFYRSGFCIPQTAGWQPSLHYPANHTAGLSSPSQNLERDLWVFHQTPGSDPEQLPAPQVWQGQEGHLTHTAWETGMQFTLPDTPGVFIFLAVGYPEEEQGLRGPHVSSLVSKGKFQ